MLAHTPSMTSMLAGELLRPFFDSTFPFDRSSIEAIAPRVDILDTADGLELLCDAPGVQPCDVEVTMNNGTLTLTLQRSLRYTSGELRLSERSEGRFTRAFHLGDAFDPDQVSAKLANGVLSVHVARRAEVRPRRIPVRLEASAPDRQLGGAVPSSTPAS